ncbi:outer membrane protein [Parablastomonas sp. CN1-191]|uniref:outer membrane protein n=1 Tax=Parablastomonas sp. CN1-191 TaxID=3400908 RepID=UPI003BF8ADF6
MRKVLLPLVAAMAISTPALANEGRVEARGGVYWTDGYTKATAGAAAGYDFDIGQRSFVGGEVSADKVLDDGANVVFGFTGRAGVRTGNAGKLYVNGGYSDDFQSNSSHAWHAGAGYEQGFGGNLYGKVEYRHFFVKDFQDSNAVVAGLGVKF